MIGMHKYSNGEIFLQLQQKYLCGEIFYSSNKNTYMERYFMVVIHKYLNGEIFFMAGIHKYLNGEIFLWLEHTHT